MEGPVPCPEAWAGPGTTVGWWGSQSLVTMGSAIIPRAKGPRRAGEKWKPGQECCHHKRSELLSERRCQNRQWVGFEKFPSPSLSCPLVLMPVPPSGQIQPEGIPGDAAIGGSSPGGTERTEKSRERALPGWMEGENQEPAFWLNHQVTLLP